MSVDSYLEARAEFAETGRELKRISRLLSTAGAALYAEPLRVVFDHQPVCLPPEVLLATNAHRFDARTWPTVDQIAQLLARHHASRAAMIEAWNLVPPQHRKSMVPPESN